MPFATLPSSPGFVAPQAPDWTRFAAQANEMIANQPQLNTAALVQNAVTQINEILKMNSPEAKLTREYKTLMLQQQKEMMIDYKSNPGKYTFKNGHLQLKDNFDQLLKQLRVRKLASGIDKDNASIKAMQGGGNSNSSLLNDAASITGGDAPPDTGLSIESGTVEQLGGGAPGNLIETDEEREDREDSEDSAEEVDE